ncbi:MAG: DUF4180 domain-containing protein [Rhizobiaceae bacterium]|nr:DUF4180 domain-containing protein [Rhizobiaceae bacterium]
MPGTIHRQAGLTVLELPDQGGPLGALDIIGETYGQGVDWVAIPASRLPADFFSLRSGVLGEFTQKFVNYGLRLAVIGDVSAHIEASEAFRAYHVEANRGPGIRFADDMAGLLDNLGRQPGR